MELSITWKSALAAEIHQPRAGHVITHHGAFSTPAFMPVGTRGAVKGILTHMLRDLGCEIMLANTYHLYLRPGTDVIANHPDTLRGFMSWDGPLLTDSGGYQVLSLSAIRTISDEGVEFRSTYDGSKHLFTPERVVEIQAKLGSTFMMQLDHLHAHSQDAHSQDAHSQDEGALSDALRRTTLWYQRSKEALKAFPTAGMLVPILQGGCTPTLRAQHLDQLMALTPPAMMAIGGLAVGESTREFEDTLSAIMEIFPKDRLTYLMGVGEPENLLHAISLGVDLFDCVLPTRNGRNGQAFTSQGKINLRNAQHTHDPNPIEDGCNCMICLNYSRSYLHHQFKVKDMNSSIALSMHNLFFFFSFLSRIRESIACGTFESYKADFLNRYHQCQHT